MSRRTEATPIGPWYLRLSREEQGLRESDLRREGDRWVVGTDPWADCGICGLVRDTAEYPACPGCQAYHAYRRREQAAADALTAPLDDDTTVN